MRKLTNYLLIACLIAAVEVFGGNTVSAEPVTKASSIYTNPAGETNQYPIPKLIKVEQTSPNQVEVTYDRDIDINLGTKPSNYWVQDVVNPSPKGIATLGKNDSVNNKNSLTASMVKIQPKAGSAKTFTLTFSQNIPKGSENKLIICYVTVKGAPAYSGDNGSATFVGK